MMHRDHGIFERGISLSRKIRMTFLSEARGRESVSMFAPLYYSRGRDDTDELECYYLWDFEAAEGYNFTALPPARIVGMELTEESFKFEEIRDFRHTAGNLEGGPRRSG